MSTIKHQVRAYLSFFIETAEKDISNLIKIAKQGEQEYKEGLESGRYDRSKLMTTLSPDTTTFYTFGSQPSRCTIPLAMACLSSNEIIGSLIKNTGYTRNFQNSANCFFIYAGHTINTAELNLLRAIYRNGMMHGFFPKGQKIGITFDSSLESKLKLFYVEDNHIILNVNRLCAITLNGFSKLFTDDIIHATIDSNLTQFITLNGTETQSIITAFKDLHE